MFCACAVEVKTWLIVSRSGVFVYTTTMEEIEKVLKSNGPEESIPVVKVRLEILIYLFYLKIRLVIKYYTCFFGICT